HLKSKFLHLGSHLETRAGFFLLVSSLKLYLHRSLLY
ncbi:hypothetical protein Trydic_g14100, partial [Trypoxylus dichotomus]